MGKPLGVEDCGHRLAFMWKLRVDKLQTPERFFSQLVRQNEGSPRLHVYSGEVCR